MWERKKKGLKGRRGVRRGLITGRNLGSGAKRKTFPCRGITKREDELGGTVKLEKKGSK